MEEILSLLKSKFLNHNFEKKEIFNANETSSDDDLTDPAIEYYLILVLICIFASSPEKERDESFDQKSNVSVLNEMVLIEEFDDKFYSLFKFDDNLL